MGALAHLGVYNPPPDHQHHSADDSNNYIFIFDESTCPSLVPIPVHVVAAAIKTKVPVLQFQDFLLLQEGREPEAEEEAESSTSSSSSPSPSPSHDWDRKGDDDIFLQKMCTICFSYHHFFVETNKFLGNLLSCSFNLEAEGHILLLICSGMTTPLMSGFPNFSQTSPINN